MKFLTLGNLTVIMPSMIIASSKLEDNVLFQNLPKQIEKQESQVVNRECNSETKYFRMWKGKRVSMGHPGHNFHRSLNTVSENSRSQSLPSCLENEPLSKEANLVDDKSDAVKTENESVLCDIKEDNICNHAWFKTWPERGTDKFITQNNNNIPQKIKTNDETKCVHNCADKLICDHMNVVTNSVSGDMSSLKHLDSSDFKNTSSKETYICKGHMSPSFPPNHTQSPNDCDMPQNLHQLSLVQNEVKYSIPLNELLQSMPLAYSPVTKQLHIVNKSFMTKVEQFAPQDQLKTVFDECDKSTFTKNGLKELDCEEKKGLLVNVNDRCDLDYVTASNCDDSLSYESPRSTLQRINTYDTSLSRTDASSFSSIVSSLSESSPSTNEEPVQVNLLDPESVISSQGIHESLSSGDSSCFEETGAKPKRRGISSFFSRNVFSWKLIRENTASNTNNPSSCSTAPSWKLFGKTAVKLRQEDPEEDGDNISTSSSCTKQYEDIVASSSALILHQRPSNLPAKSQDEEQKHRHEYERMVEAARKKELKEAKLRKKQLQQQLKQEEKLASAARIWNNEILPKWETMKSSRKAQDLWWQGIPPSVRGKVWRLAIGNDLNITRQLYEICVTRAQERLKAATEAEQKKLELCTDNPDKEASVELIQLDIARTFPNLCIFQKGGPYYDILHSLLGAYVCYRPDVGYVQGMSFIAAVLILNLEAADAFVCFANLLNQPCHMAFFRLNQTLMQAYYATYNDFFQENLPRLFSHFTESCLSPDLYLLDWLYTGFAKAMPLDVACRVWDVYLRDGEEFLFKTALGVLHLHQDVLLQLDFLHGAQFLTKLPDDLAADHLFKSIESIHMNVGKLRFSEVLASHTENCWEPS